MTVLECVITNGGPLIAIPSELAPAWRGTLPPSGVAVPPGWEWGQGGVVCDYDRACGDMEDRVTVGDDVSTWTVAVAARRALILDGEISTAAISCEDGVVLVREPPIETEDEARAIVASVKPASWIASDHELELREGRLFVFDSAYEGAPTAAEIEADGGVLDILLAPGVYRVHYAAPGHPDAPRLTLIRLSPVAHARHA